MGNDVKGVSGIFIVLALNLNLKNGVNYDTSN